MGEWRDKTVFRSKEGEIHFGDSQDSQHLLHNGILSGEMADVKCTHSGLKGEKKICDKTWNSTKDDTKKHTDFINIGDDDEMEIWGYKVHPARYIGTVLLVIVTGGLLGLPLYWVRRWWLMMTRVRCSLAEATSVLVVDNYKGLHTIYFVKDVYKISNSEGNLISPCYDQPDFKDVSCFRYFNCKKNRYIWDDNLGNFFKVQGLDRNINLGQLLQYKNGLSDKDITSRAFLYGANEIVVPMENLLVLAVKEILTPFYCFQIFSISFWYYDEYRLYATAILLTSVISVACALYQTRTNQQNLRDRIVSSEVVTRVKDDGTYVEVISSELVPGDLIVVPDHGCQLLCDAVLLEGQVIMDESMLTGESVPVTKMSVDKDNPDILYHGKEYENNTLKCGTQVIQTRKLKDQVVTAVVIRTGYLTSKGDLVRSILYPPPVDFQFEKDSYKFIIMLACVAMIGMAYTIIRMALIGTTFHDIMMEALDLVTIVVPPALPAAMTIGIVLANQRLVPKNIFCISPRTINVAGTTNCVCFDKTGTITEDGMDMWGVLPVTIGLSTLNQDGHDDEVSVEWAEPVREVTEMPTDSLLVLGMATCHDLNMINEKVMGDPHDEKMFSSTQWTMEVGGEEQSQTDQLVMPYMKSPNTTRSSVLQAATQKLFPFSSDLQRMCVVTRIVEEVGKEDTFTNISTLVFCKGSPEVIEQMCRPTTIPSNYRDILKTYTSRGFRILALAGRLIPANLSKINKINKLTRDQFETDLNLLGLIVLENRLKPVSSEVLTELHGAGIRPIMVTGDNIDTAVSVAKDCGLVPSGEKVIRVCAEQEGVKYISLHTEQEIEQTKLQMEGGEPYHFAIDGTSFDIIFNRHKETLIPSLATRGSVFARMRPDMKQRLVEILQDLDYCVIMCGDGANDCGALKAANAGISLSDAEASVASPFTSKTPDISCVPTLIRESRAALVTSFGIFKYMAAYSITQFVSVMILYDIYANLSDFQFVYIDLFLITTMAALFGFNGSYSGPLDPNPPRCSLFGVLPIFSLLSQLAIMVVVQVTTLFYTRSQPWFVQFDSENPCYINTTAETYFNSTGLQLEADACDADEDPVASYENYAIFSVSQFQYIILVIVYSKGAPYRESIFRNLPLLLDILLLIGFSMFLTLWPEGWTNALLQFLLFPPPGDFVFRFVLIGLVFGHLLVSLFTEFIISDIFVYKLTNSEDKKYQKIEKELEQQPDWPPISSPTEISERMSPSSTSSNEVYITETDIARPSNQAFNSLFSTPESHSEAATSLNVCNTPPAPIPGPELVLSSPSYKTARPSLASSPETDNNLFQSCDSNINTEYR